MYYFFTLLLFLITSFLQASTVAVTENDPNSLVEGVSVITGDLYSEKEDVYIQGVQPIRLRRSYISQKGEGYWNSFSYHQIFLNWNAKLIEVVEPGGAILIYEGIRSEKALQEEKAHEGTLYGDKLKESGHALTFSLKHSSTKGMTNTGRGTLSGLYNIKNQRVVLGEVGRFLTQDPLGLEAGANLYAFLLNAPLTHYDLYGLSTEGFFSNPRVQGAFQVIGGMAEAGVGANLTLGTFGLGGVLGWPLLAHGLDNALAGGYAVIHGRPRNAATTQLLEKTGMSPRAATLTNEALGIAGTLGGAAVIQASKIILTQGNKAISSAYSVSKAPKVQYQTVQRAPSYAENIGARQEKAKFLFNSWDKGTFPNRMQSIKYHVQKHGNNYSYEEYTKKSIDFFNLNKENALTTTLKNGKKGYSIKIKKRRF